MHRQALHVFIILTLAVSVSSKANNPKYRYWFPKYNSHWLQVSALCQTQIDDYHNDIQIRYQSTYARVADCLLANTIETIKSNLASGAILLGLSTGILALLGPTITDLGLLSTRYPTLAILLALASPATNIAQFYRGCEDVTGLLRKPDSVSLKTWHAWLMDRSSTTRRSILALQMLLAAAMIVNNVHVSLFLDYRSVSGFHCNQMFMPPAWSIISVVVHAFGFLAIYTRKTTGDNMSESKSSARKAAQSWFVRRGGICGILFEWKGWESLVTGRDTLIGEILMWTASLATIVHMVFGILVFSSILFVSVVDALLVITRYAISADVCQIILIVKLAEIRLDLTT